jgi:centrosomal protein CEP290
VFISKRLLDTLEKDEFEVRRILAESTRQMYVVRSNEKQLERKCAALKDLEIKLVKENKKLRTDMIQMEVSIKQRLGYLERYREMCNFKITSLIKMIDECVPKSKLDELNKNYDELASNYRQLLDKQDVFETKTDELSEADEKNKKYAHEIQFLRKTLESEKEKVHILEKTIDRLKYLSDTPAKGSKEALISHEDSLSKRLIAIEMNEINEKQRADHAQKMYDEQRRVLRVLENRNLELEENYSKLSKLYLNLQKAELKLREDLSTSVPQAINEGDKARIHELEESESLLKIEVARLRELSDITLYQTEAIEFIKNLNRKEMEILGSIEVLATDDNKTEMAKLHRQIVTLQISEATAIRKLQNALRNLKQVETELAQTEQKLDKEVQDHFMTKKEYSSKIFYLRSIVQDLRHKYSGSIPLKQQEKYIQTKQQLLENKKEITLKLQQINSEQIELEDKIIEYEIKLKGLSELQIINKSSDSQKLNDRLLDWHKKTENHRIQILKLERANKRYKEEVNTMH